MSKARYIGIGASALLIAGVAATSAVGHGTGGHGFRGGMGGPGMGGRGGGIMKLFNKLDANRDQVITREEAEKARDEKFAGMDANKDGTVSVAEIDKVIEKRLNRMRIRMRYRMLGRLDTDGDGSINKQEFDQRAAHRFEWADRDGDGNVTREEAAFAARKMKRHMGGMMGRMGGGNMGGMMRHMRGGYMSGGQMGGGYMRGGYMRGGQMGGGQMGGQTGGANQE